VYYAIMAAYCVWGLIALRLTPDPLTLAIVSTTLGNVGLAVSTLQVLYLNRRLLPPPLRPGLWMDVWLMGSFMFFLGISVIAFYQRWMALFGS
jgi:hypothetical protein